VDNQTVFAYSSTMAQLPHQRAWYLANREHCLVKSEARRLARAADPETAAVDRAYAREHARKRRALAPPKPPRKIKFPVNRYTDPDYHAAQITRSSLRHAAFSLAERFWNGAKGRALTRLQEFTITIEDICIPEKCPICEVVLRSSSGRMNQSSPTLDRVDSSGGYVPGNVAVICHRCNFVKSNGTAELHERIAAYMRKGGPQP